MSDSENFEVEDIVNHRHKKGKVEYLIRWKGYSPSDDSWEPVDNLDCPDKIAAYNEKVKLTQSTSSARTAQKRDNDGSEPMEITSNKIAKKRPDNEIAQKSESEYEQLFKKYEAEKIVGATDEYGDLHFLIKWKNNRQADMVPSKIANVKIPQMVIGFYEERLTWGPESKN
jgi:hypothetical protein